jgi:pimeloyl-ACP methyl ester carboxylesterase
VREEGNTCIGDATVHWRRDGDGPALVFLHGFPLSGATWDGVVARLRDRFTCWAPDLIGLGASRSTTDGDYASPGQARLFRALLSELGVGPYALVGNDTGGWIARELALVDAGRVTHLVLTNTEIPRHRPPWIPTYQVLAHLPGSGAVIGQLLRSAAFRRSSLAFGGCFHDAARIEGDFRTRFVDPLVAGNGRMDGAMRFLREMKFARLDEFERLHAELRMPTLLVWGADDPTFPVARARDMLPQFGNVAGFQPVAEAKLFVQEEQPQTVAERIGGFVATC